MIGKSPWSFFETIFSDKGYFFLKKYLREGIFYDFF